MPAGYGSPDYREYVRRVHTPAWPCRPSHGRRSRRLRAHPIAEYARLPRGSVVAPGTAPIETFDSGGTPVALVRPGAPVPELPRSEPVEEAPANPDALRRSWQCRPCGAWILKGTPVTTLSYDPIARSWRHRDCANPSPGGPAFAGRERERVVESVHSTVHPGAARARAFEASSVNLGSDSIRINLSTVDRDNAPVGASLILYLERRPIAADLVWVGERFGITMPVDPRAEVANRVEARGSP